MNDLVARCLAGDASAADELCRAYHVRIREYAVARGASRADAEDLSQETLIAALDGIRRGRRPERLTWWLLGIARNLHRNLDAPVLGGPLPEAGLRDPDQAGARTVAARREIHGLLDRSLRDLSESDQDLLAMLHREGLDRKEIAQRLKVDPRALHARVERAHARLRESVEQHFGTEVARRKRGGGPDLERIQALRPAFRQVIQARHLEELDEAAASARLGLPLPTLRARLRGAYEALKVGEDADFARAREQFRSARS
jgi:RNA polymerase sigma-70 factor (ECF subfamily)